MKNIEKFTINRKKWLRGDKNKPDQDSVLLNEAGQKCCLGFYALACGARRSDILGVSTPEGVFYDTRKIIPNLIYRESDNKICNRLMAINDSDNTNDARKEKAIKNNFAKLGVKVEFVG